MYSSRWGHVVGLPKQPPNAHPVSLRQAQIHSATWHCACAQSSIEALTTREAALRSEVALLETEHAVKKNVNDETSLQTDCRKERARGVSQQKSAREIKTRLIALLSKSQGLDGEDVPKERMKNLRTSLSSDIVLKKIHYTWTIPYKKFIAALQLYDYSSHQCSLARTRAGDFKGSNNHISWILVSRILSKEPPFEKDALLKTQGT